MTKKNQQLPDFKELNDRIIAEASPSPSIVIKTNLDEEDVSIDNPYSNKSTGNSEEFKNFFKE
jgi:hypothetical protein